MTAKPALAVKPAAELVMRGGVVEPDGVVLFAGPTGIPAEADGAGATVAGVTGAVGAGVTVMVE